MRSSALDKLMRIPGFWIDAPWIPDGLSFKRCSLSGPVLNQCLASSVFPATATAAHHRRCETLRHRVVDRRFTADPCPTEQAGARNIAIPTACTSTSCFPAFNDLVRLHFTRSTSRPVSG